MQSEAAGNLLLKNAVAAGFGLLQFGGTTNAYPALKRSSTTLQVRLADDSGDAGLKAKTLTLSALPTSDPGVPGALWNSAGTVKISP
jgi:hypothetical protein